jgi:hypothetical protein
MFGYGYGRGYGRGYGFGGRGRGYGLGYGRGWGRGACLEYYRTHGTWPAWSRWAGGPGYWRAAAMGMVDEPPVAPVPPVPPAPAAAPPRADEVSSLREEVAALRAQIDEALRRLGNL